MPTKYRIAHSGLAIIFSGFITISQAQTKSVPAKPIYKDPKQSLETRVANLLSYMTLEEKVAQTQCLWTKKKLILDNKGDFDPTKAESILKNGLGQIARVSESFGSIEKSRGPAETVEIGNKIQKYFVEKTRLGIPVIFHEESLHGNQAKDATNFPTPMALASSWNPALMTEIYTHVAEEVRVRGAHHVLAPVVDLARDPRWGRTEETMGEDPYLVSRLGVSIVKAYQGSDPNYIGPKNVAATLKHFGVHGMPEGGVNVAPSFSDERHLREVYLPSFKACVQEGKAASIMPCYNELSGIPAHANRKLLTDILRKEWGFKGVVVSDYMAIDDLRTIHKIVEHKDTAGAGLKAFYAGVDIETPDISGYGKLAELVKSGKISAAELDSSVARTLRLKFRLGLFEKPYADPKVAEAVIGSKENRAIALKAAHQSMVLLKNDGNLLPLDKTKIKKIALIGPNADRCILGGYSNIPRQTVTPLQAIKEKLGKNVEIIYAEGCRITDKGDWFSDNVELSKPEENRKRIAEAVNAAKNADVIVLFVGGNEAITREAWATNHMGDLPNLELIGEQNELIKAITALNKPTAAVVNSGQPFAFKYLSETVPAIIQAWYLGQETGYAVADALFGDINPSGKLAISIPRSAGHIPCYYNYKPSARRGYIFESVKPLYPFGFGLSYTSYKYDAPKLSASTIKSRDNVTVSVNITNTGKVKGDEIVQVYVRDKVSNVTRPVKELKGFDRVTLNPGESKTVNITLGPDAFAYYNENMVYGVEPGAFEIMVGKSSDDLSTVELQIEK